MLGRILAVDFAMLPSWQPIWLAGRPSPCPIGLGVLPSGTFLLELFPQCLRIPLSLVVLLLRRVNLRLEGLDTITHPSALLPPVVPLLGQAFHLGLELGCL